MDYNKEHYEKQYLNEIAYKYKTNTRYQRFLIKLLERNINHGEIYSVCDVGCGQGLNTVFFADDFPESQVLGIDLSNSGIAYANKNYGGARIQFECGNILDFELSAQKFDMVTAFELLEHIEDWKSIAIAMTKAATKYIMVSVPIGRMRAYEVNHGHYRNFQRGELEHFFEQNGFNTVEVYYAGFPFWSPITRDLLNLMPGDSTKAQENMSLFGKASSLILYFLFRYCSSRKKYGDQFIGLFKKKD